MEFKEEAKVLKKKNLLIFGAILVIGLAGTGIIAINWGEGVSEDKVYVNVDNTSTETEYGYSKKSNLVEIPVDLEDSNDSVLYVETLQGLYMSTIADGKLTYIGKAPTSDNPILNISLQEVETSEIPKSSIHEINGDLVYKVNADGVKSISFTPQGDNSRFIPIEMVGNEFIITIPKTIYETSDKFTLNLSRSSELEVFK